MATMRVRANFNGNQSAFGFYGTKRRYDGDVFDFEYDPADPKLGKWMEPMEELRRKPGPKPKADKVDES